MQTGDVRISGLVRLPPEELWQVAAPPQDEEGGGGGYEGLTALSQDAPNRRCTNEACERRGTSRQYYSVELTVRPLLVNCIRLPSFSPAMFDCCTSGSGGG